MTDPVLPGTAALSARIASLERQCHALLFLSAANTFLNVMTLVLWAMLSSG